MQQQKQQIFSNKLSLFSLSNSNKQNPTQQQIVLQPKKQPTLNIFQNQFNLQNKINNNQFVNQINNNQFVNQINNQQFDFQNNIKIQQYFKPQKTEEYIKLLKFQVYRETLITNINIANDFYQKKEEYLAKIKEYENQIKEKKTNFEKQIDEQKTNFKNQIDTQNTEIKEQINQNQKLNENIKVKTIEIQSLKDQINDLQKQTDKDKEKIEIVNRFNKYLLKEKIINNKTIFEKFCNKLQENIVDPIKTIYFLFTLQLKKEILYKNFQTKFIPLTIYVLSSGFLIHSIIKDKKISFFHKMALIIAIKYAFSCFLKMNIDQSKYFEQEENNNKIIAFGDFINLSFASFLLFNKTLAKLLFSEEESPNYAANKKKSYGYNEFKYLYFFASIINIIAALTIAIQLPSIPIVGEFAEIINIIEKVYKKN